MKLESSLRTALATVLLPAVTFAQWTSHDLGEARNGLAVTNVGQYILVAGGFSAGSASGLVEIYDAQNRTWSTSQLSIPRNRLSGVSHDELAYFAGGRDDTNAYSDRIDVFDSATRRWSQLSLPEARSGMAAASAGDSLVFAGGNLALMASKRVDVYHVPTGTWTQTELSVERNQAAAVSVGDEVIVAGGQGSNGFLTNAEIYNVVTGTWRVDPVPGNGFLGAGAVVDGKAYFTGGLLGTGGLIPVYDGATQSWSSIIMPVPRGQATPVAFGRQVLFCGGDIFPNSQDRVDSYDTVTGQWSLSFMPERRHDLKGASVYGRIVVAGGFRNAMAPDLALVFEPNVGFSACGPANPHSGGIAATLRAVGSDLAGGQPLALVAESMPADRFGLFLASRSLDAMIPPGSDGVLCLGAPLGRFSSQVVTSSSAGVASIPVDTEDLPVAGFPVAMAGETWFFQTWFRDAGGSSNLTDAVSITFN